MGAQEFIKGETAHVQGLVVEGDQVVFRLMHPFAFLPERLASSFFSIVPEGTPIDASEPPVGTGVYRLVAWDRVKHKIVLEKTDHGWAPPTASSPERLVIHVFPSEGVAVEELVAGTLDWLETTAAALPLLESSTSAGDLRIETPPQNDIRLVALNMKRAEFADNPAIGIALNYATDREAIVHALGFGRPVRGP